MPTSRSRRTALSSSSLILAAVLSFSIVPTANSLHHMQLKLSKQLLPRQAYGSRPLVVTNYCSDTIYPGISTQNGDGPASTGFELSPGDTFNQTVGIAWQGRVWGRTNCSFNNGGGGGKACGSGDCNGAVQCEVGGDTPVTLAEFTLDAGDGQTYYDISLVDGYNMPLAIVMHGNGNSSLEDIPPNLTNPSCVATVGQLADQSFDPYNNQQQFLGTNSSDPLPFDTQVDNNQVANWCPWDLQVSPPTKPGDGVYPYPDDKIQRPEFDPCYSACAKWNQPSDCCTGDHDQPSTCQPSEYSQAAKGVCPDAYSYAFDDQTSTFIIPAGAGFEVIFCPGGRSTNILASKADQEHQLQSNGNVNTNGKLMLKSLLGMIVGTHTVLGSTKSLLLASLVLGVLLSCGIL